MVSQSVLNGTFTLTRETPNVVHRAAAVEEALDVGCFRLEGSVHGGGGTVNAMGLAFHGPHTGERGENLRRIYGDGIARIATITPRGHLRRFRSVQPVLLRWQQTHVTADDERRAREARFRCHRHPATHQLEYNRSLRDMFEFGDAKPYITFTLSCFDPS